MSEQNLENIINIFMIAVILLFLWMVCKKMSYKSNKELFNIGGQYDYPDYNENSNSNYYPDYPDYNENSNYYPDYNENSNSNYYPDNSMYENKMNNGNKGCDITLNGKCYIATEP